MIPPRYGDDADRQRTQCDGRATATEGPDIDRESLLTAECRLCGATVPAGSVPADAVAPLAFGSLLTPESEARLREHLEAEHAGNLASHDARPPLRHLLEFFEFATEAYPEPPPEAA